LPLLFDLFSLFLCFLDLFLLPAQLVAFVYELYMNFSFAFVYELYMNFSFQFNKFPIGAFAPPVWSKKVKRYQTELYKMYGQALSQGTADIRMRSTEPQNMAYNVYFLKLF
jgi:hypothetical protein